MTIKIEDLSVIGDYYLPRLKFFGGGAAAAGWSTEGNQEIRFDALLAVCGDWTGQSILDVGCGTGDLLSFMDSRALPYKSYFGQDVLRQSINTCRRRFPGIYDNFSYAPVTVMADTYRTRYDYVVASGVFNLRTPNHHQIMLDSVKAMWCMCSKAVAVNFLKPSHVRPESDDVILVADPLNRLDELTQLTGTEYWAIEEDYLYNDFTVYLFRSEMDRENSSIFYD